MNAKLARPDWKKNLQSCFDAVKKTEQVGLTTSEIAAAVLPFGERFNHPPTDVVSWCRKQGIGFSFSHMLPRIEGQIGRSAKVFVLTNKISTQKGKGSVIDPPKYKEPPVLTLGGIATGKDQPYTLQQFDKIKDEAKEED